MARRKRKCKLVTEKRCRAIIEELTGKKFTKKRIYHNPENKRSFIELDGYNAELNMAFEYNGYQHYVFPNTFHKRSRKKFDAQQERDRRKEAYCEDNGIKLIIIPYTELETLEEFITTKVDQLTSRRRKK